MGKKRKTFSIDEDLHQFLTEENNDLNASSVVNSLLREYRAAGKAPEAALTKRVNELEAKITQKQQEKARLESRIDQLKRQRDDAAEQLRKMRENRHDAVLTVAALVRDEDQPHTLEELTTDHPLIVDKAEASELTPERFMEELKREL